MNLQDDHFSLLPAVNLAQPMAFRRVEAVSDGQDGSSFNEIAKSLCAAVIVGRRLAKL
jgi:hypothetical protein